MVMTFFNKTSQLLTTDTGTHQLIPSQHTATKDIPGPKRSRGTPCCFFSSSPQGYVLAAKVHRTVTFVFSVIFVPFSRRLIFFAANLCSPIYLSCLRILFTLILPCIATKALLSYRACIHIYCTLQHPTSCIIWICCPACPVQVKI